MRARWIITAAALGGLAAAWWFLLHWRSSPVAGPAPLENGGGLVLAVEHKGPELRLRWSPEQVRDATGGTLIISDGSHQSKLDLDEAELRSGTASYWPQAGHVRFRLETEGGAWGSLKVPAWDVETTERPAPAEEPAPAKPHPHRSAEAKGKPSHHAVRAADPPSKTGSAARSKSASGKIPSWWKLPKNQ